MIHLSNRTSPPSDDDNADGPTAQSYPGTANSNGSIDNAKNAFHLNPKNTVRRLICHKPDDAAKVQCDMKHSPFIVSNKVRKSAIQVTYKGKMCTFVSQVFFLVRHLVDFRFKTPEEVSTTVLVKMKETFKAYLSKRVTHEVVTVPACEFYYCH